MRGLLIGARMAGGGRQGVEASAAPIDGELNRVKANWVSTLIHINLGMYLRPTRPIPAWAGRISLEG